MLLPCKYAVLHAVDTPSAFFFYWDLQATVLRTSYLIKKEKTVLAFPCASRWPGGEGKQGGRKQGDGVGSQNESKCGGKNTKGVRNKGKPLLFVFLCCEE